MTRNREYQNTPGDSIKSILNILKSRNNEKDLKDILTSEELKENRKAKLENAKAELHKTYKFMMKSFVKQVFF